MGNVTSDISQALEGGRQFVPLLALRLPNQEAGPTLSRRTVCTRRRGDRGDKELRVLCGSA